MFGFLLFSLVGVAMGQINLPHGHDLKTIVDKAFTRLDHNPTDGVVTQAEFNMIITRDDTDKNGCVSYLEFANSQNNQPSEVVNKVFHHFDSDGDMCLNVQDMQQEFHLIDHDGNGDLRMHEWEKYFTHLMHTLFGNGHTGK